MNPKTQEYVVVVEPEYGSEEHKAPARRSLTTTATSPADAAMIAIRALLRMNVKTCPRTDGRRERDALTVRRFLSRPDKEGDRHSVIVDLSPAEKKSIADAEAAKEAADAAERAAMKTEADAYAALRAEHPSLYVSISPCSRRGTSASATTRGGAVTTARSWTARSPARSGRSGRP